MDAVDVKEKYILDINRVNSYIQYIENFFLSSLLSNSKMLSLSPTFYETPTIPTIQQKYSIIYSEIQQHLSYLQTELSQISVSQLDSDTPNCDTPTPDGDILLFLCTEIRKGNTYRQTLFETAIPLVEALCISKGELIGGERFCEIYDDPAILDYLIDVAINIEATNRCHELEQDITYAQDSLKALELFDLYNPLNIYRQSFIQVMAFFDSCMFDIAETCMNQDFFKWLPQFENTNIKTHDLAKAESYSNFQLKHIHTLLRSCYVKDIISIFHKMDDQPFINLGADVYADLREMINRRNAHIHNNGYVDSAYMENFNIYKFEAGDYLLIDKAYLAKVQSTTTDLIKSIITTIKSI